MKYITLFLLVFIQISTHAQSYENALYYYKLNYISEAIDDIKEAIEGPEKNNAQAYVLMYKIFKTASTTPPFDGSPDLCLIQCANAACGALNQKNGTWAMEQEFGKQYLNVYINLYKDLTKYANFHLEKGNHPNTFLCFEGAYNVYKVLYNSDKEMFPMEHNLTFYTGYSAINAEKYTEAAKYFGELVDYDFHEPEYSSVYYWMAKYHLLETKNMQKAKETFDKGLKYYPNDEDLLSLKSYFEE